MTGGYQPTRGGNASRIPAGERGLTATAAAQKALRGGYPPGGELPDRALQVGAKLPPPIAEVADFADLRQALSIVVQQTGCERFSGAPPADLGGAGEPADVLGQLAHGGQGHERRNLQDRPILRGSFLLEV